MENRRRPSYLTERLARNIRILRNEQGWSQEALADRCRLHRTYVGAIERAERNISIATLEALADGLGVDPTELLAIEVPTANS